MVDSAWSPCPATGDSLPQIPGTSWVSPPSVERSSYGAVRRELLPTLRGAEIPAAAEPKDQQEDPRQEHQADGEANPVAKGLGQVVEHCDRDDETHDRDDVEDQPPPGAADDLEQNQQVPDRDERRDARLVAFWNTPTSGRAQIR